MKKKKKEKKILFSLSSTSFWIRCQDMSMIDIGSFYFLRPVPFWNCCQFDLDGLAWGTWAGLGTIRGACGIGGNDCRVPNSEGGGGRIGSIGSVERSSEPDLSLDEVRPFDQPPPPWEGELVWLVSGISCELLVSSEDQPAFLNVGLWLLDGVVVCGCRSIADTNW
jgi:hypothetical protein